MGQTEEGADRPHPLLASDFLPAGLHFLRHSSPPAFFSNAFSASGILQISQRLPKQVPQPAMNAGVYQTNMRGS